jgi:hypothetical protein
VEPRWGKHHHAQNDDEELYDDINMIFDGSMVIALKTQGKKLESE